MRFKRIYIRGDNYWCRKVKIGINGASYDLVKAGDDPDKVVEAFTKMK